MNAHFALKLARQQFGPAASIRAPDRTDDSTGLHYIFVPTDDDYWATGLYPIGFGDDWDKAFTNAVRHSAELQQQGRAFRQGGEFLFVTAPAPLAAGSRPT